MIEEEFYTVLLLRVHDDATGGSSPTTRTKLLILKVLLAKEEVAM